MFRGLRLLSSPELVRYFIGRIEHLKQIDDIRAHHPTCRIKPDVLLNAYLPERLVLGTRVSINSGTVLSFGDDHNGFGQISIGDETWIGQYNNFRAGGGEIKVGRGCLISQFCSLVASNHGVRRDVPIHQQSPSDRSRGITIGDDVWIGANVCVLPGVTINRGAVIGAGSVVTKNVPEYEIWGGVPAAKMRVRATPANGI